MARTFAGVVAAEVGQLKSELQGAAAGFREVTTEATKYVDLQRTNLDLAREKLSVLSNVNQPLAPGGVVSRVNGPGQVGGILSRINGPAGGSGVIASVNGPTVGDRQIARILVQGFRTLDHTIRTGQQDDGGALFRASGGI